jgi:hypothetical protein
LAHRAAVLASNCLLVISRNDQTPTVTEEQIVKH